MVPKAKLSEPKLIQSSKDQSLGPKAKARDAMETQVIINNHIKTHLSKRKLHHQIEKQNKNQKLNYFNQKQEIHKQIHHRPSRGSICLPTNLLIASSSALAAAAAAAAATGASNPSQLTADVRACVTATYLCVLIVNNSWLDCNLLEMLCNSNRTATGGANQMNQSHKLPDWLTASLLGYESPPLGLIPEQLDSLESALDELIEFAGGGNSFSANQAEKESGAQTPGKLSAPVHLRVEMSDNWLNIKPAMGVTSDKDSPSDKLVRLYQDLEGSITQNLEAQTQRESTSLIGAPSDSQRRAYLLMMSLIMMAKRQQQEQQLQESAENNSFRSARLGHTKSHGDLTQLPVALPLTSTISPANSQLVHFVTQPQANWQSSNEGTSETNLVNRQQMQILRPIDRTEIYLAGDQSNRSWPRGSPDIANQQQAYQEHLMASQFANMSLGQFDSTNNAENQDDIDQTNERQSNKPVDGLFAERNRPDQEAQQSSSTYADLLNSMTNEPKTIDLAEDSETNIMSNQRQESSFRPQQHQLVHVISALATTPMSATRITDLPLGPEQLESHQFQQQQQQQQRNNRLGASGQVQRHHILRVHNNKQIQRVQQQQQQQPARNQFDQELAVGSCNCNELADIFETHVTNSNAAKIAECRFRCGISAGAATTPVMILADGNQLVAAASGLTQQVSVSSTSASPSLVSPSQQTTSSPASSQLSTQASIGSSGKMNPLDVTFLLFTRYHRDLARDLAQLSSSLVSSVQSAIGSVSIRPGDASTNNQQVSGVASSGSNSQPINGVGSQSSQSSQVSSSSPSTSSSTSSSSGASSSVIDNLAATSETIDLTNETTLNESRLNSSLPIKIIVHGFGSGGRRPWVTDMVYKLLDYEDVNVIVVDWEKGATLPNYVQAAGNTRLVGHKIACLIKSINAKYGLTGNSYHLIGFSLGAHVAGFAGMEIRNSTSLSRTWINRITGLDPASPLFEGYEATDRLDPSDAQFVDVIHSNGDGVLRGGFGSLQPMGHVDFYPNGGRVQVGCNSVLLSALSDIIYGKWQSLCNHRRALNFFMDSFEFNKCRFRSFNCDSYESYLKGECFDCGANNEKCSYMGYLANYSKGRGKMYLTTHEEAPFCANQFIIKILGTKGYKTHWGKVEVTLVSLDGKNESFLLSSMNQHSGGNHYNHDQVNGQRDLSQHSMQSLIVAHPTLVNFTQVLLRYTKYKGWIYSGDESWSIDKVFIMDSDGQVKSFCGFNTILESHITTRLSLEPGNCTVLESSSPIVTGSGANMQQVQISRIGSTSQQVAQQTQSSRTPRILAALLHQQQQLQQTAGFNGDLQASPFTGSTNAYKRTALDRRRSLYYQNQLQGPKSTHVYNNLPLVAY